MRGAAGRGARTGVTTPAAAPTASSGAGTTSPARAPPPPPRSAAASATIAATRIRDEAIKDGDPSRLGLHFDGPSVLPDAAGLISAALYRERLHRLWTTGRPRADGP